MRLIEKLPYHEAHKRFDIIFPFSTARKMNLLFAVDWTLAVTRLL